MKKAASLLLGIILTLLYCACTLQSGPSDSGRVESRLPSSEIPQKETALAPKLITAEGIDIMVPFVDVAFTKDKLFVSQVLKDKMERYKGENVRFRVLVDLPFDEKEAEDCYQFAVKTGAVNVEPLEHSSDIQPFLKKAYFMELSADMLNRMIEHRGYVLRLAPPKRSKGYSVRIADYLTNVLDDTPDDEVLHIAAVCAVDKGNRFLSGREIPCNWDYNADLALPWTGGELNEGTVAGYIDAIVKRHHLTDKRIVDPKEKDAEIDYDGLGEKIVGIKAGFEAKLTKKEILALAEDTDIKTIYLKKAGIWTDHGSYDK